MDNRPIGFLDSGVGGLTVVRELMRQLPHEEIVYIGDSARAPYGPRPAEQIREYTWQLVNFLLTKDVKMIVIACNTATAVVMSSSLLMRLYRKSVSAILSKCRSWRRSTLKSPIIGRQRTSA